MCIQMEQKSFTFMIILLLVRFLRKTGVKFQPGQSIFHMSITWNFPSKQYISYVYSEPQLVPGLKKI